VVFNAPGAPVIAVSPFLLSKRPVAVCQQANEAVVHLLHKRGRSADKTERHDGMTAVTDHGPLRPLAILAGRRGPGGAIVESGHLCFVDAIGRFVTIAGGRLEIGPGSWAKERTFIAASRAASGAFVSVEVDLRSDLAGVHMVRASENGDLVHTKVEIDLPVFTQDTRYYFGTGDLVNLIAYSQAKSQCTIVHQTVQAPRQIETFDVPQSHTVIGMVDEVERVGDRSVVRPLAVAIDGNKTGIELLRPGERRPLLTTTALITSAAASDSAPVIAFITQSGELGVYSCTAKAMLLRVAPETMA
jgi:hypothetical protein